MCEVTKKKKILVKLLQCQKIFRGRSVQHLFDITFPETYLINMKFGDCNWASKIFERNYERNFLLKPHDIKKFWRSVLAFKIHFALLS